jgi:hypothetical protein
MEKIFETLRRDRDIASFVILSLYKYGKMSVRDLVNLVYKDWPSEIERKKKYYNKKGVSKSKEEIDEQIRVDLAQVMLNKTFKNPYGRKDFINKIGTYYELNEEGIKNAKDLIESVDNIIDDDVDDIQLFKNFKSRPKNDIESELTKAQSQIDVKPFNKFKASQSEEEKESFYGFNQNKFRQAICVLGGSGAGKSTTIENILNKEGHKFEFIIPSASTTGLLSQFSPSKSGYVPSKLGKMIVNAYSNPTQLFTAVFDECHKSNVIEMINDEILQAISIKRNNGKRFISLDDDTAELYPGTEKSTSGNILIPDNLGFIFISSNARVISGNEDFFNRVDLVELTKESRESVKTIEDLNRLRISDTDKKYELVSKIMSESKR